MKNALINIAMVIFTKNSGNALFKLRRHVVANMYEDKYKYQYFGN